MNNLKEKCALEALKYIKDQSIVGLGGGSTIAYLVEFLAKKKFRYKDCNTILSNSNVMFKTPTLCCTYMVS